MKIDCKLVGKFCSHSSLSIKSIAVEAGVVDSGYQEIIYVVLHNLSREPVTFNVGDKIAQILFEKVSLPVLTEVFDFDNYTERGTGGLGSPDGNKTSELLYSSIRSL